MTNKNLSLLLWCFITFYAVIFYVSIFFLCQNSAKPHSIVDFLSAFLQRFGGASEYSPFPRGSSFTFNRCWIPIILSGKKTLQYIWFDTIRPKTFPHKKKKPQRKKQFAKSLSTWTMKGRYKKYIACFIYKLRKVNGIKPTTNKPKSIRLLMFVIIFLVFFIFFLPSRYLQ